MRIRNRPAGGIAVAVVTAGFAIALAGCQPSTAAAVKPLHGGQSGHSPSGHGETDGAAYSFQTLDNQADPTFNQLLGFNNRGVIAGYFGSGAAGHPNKGYLLVRTPAGFAIHSENFPGAVQTQVTGLNDHGVTVGFWSSMNNANQVNDNTGFYDIGGSFHSVSFPAQDNANPPVNQLLGVNDQNEAVGFYTDASGKNHGYTFSIHGNQFRTVRIRQATSVTAAAISNDDDIAGFFTNAAGTTDGFLRTGAGRTYTLAYPGASMTQAFGVSDAHEVVGAYTVGSGNNAVTHGFTWTPAQGFQSVDDPMGQGTTTINGVNDRGDLVGFYVDGNGNTHGFAAVPGNQDPLPGVIGATTPNPSMSPSPSASPSSSPSMSPMPSMSSSPSAPPSMSPSSSSSPSMSPTPPASSAAPSPSQSQPTHW